MLYFAYQAIEDLTSPWRAVARAAELSFGGTVRQLFGSGGRLTATWELIARARLSHARPDFGIAKARVGGRELAVSEQAVMTTPFATLLRFRKEGAPPQPRILLVAPLSGHFSTLLRATVETMLPEHDVYITDWHNARQVALEHGGFGLEDYVEHVIRFLEAMGPGAHVLAVCQPCVQVLAAVALMSAESNPATPRSMTLMAGPIDTRVNPTKVNRLASSRPIEWFERTLITRVPQRYAGRRRPVYPGFLQLASFVAMNPQRHIAAHREMHDLLARGEVEKAAVIKAFYDEYCAVIDLPAEFYLETVRDVFQQHLLPRGLMRYRGRPIDPKAIRRTALLTVEGERDDICGVGQTLAAQELCSSLRPALKRHHLQPGAGHYGTFSGRKWTGQIYPLVRNLILATD